MWILIYYWNFEVSNLKLNHPRGYVKQSPRGEITHALMSPVIHSAGLSWLNVSETGVVMASISGVRSRLH